MAAAKASGTPGASASATPSSRVHRAVEEPGDAVERGLGLGQGAVVVVDRRAVVGGAEEVAHDDRPGAAQEVRGEDRVAERLRHLLPVDVDQAVVQPVRREGVAGGGRLRELVLVVREAQVESAAVDVERRAQVALATSPSTRCASPDARHPTGSPTTRSAGSPAFAPFHSAKSRGSRLPRGSASVGVDHVVAALPGERAVGGPAGGVEVDVARAVGGRVGVAALDELAMMSCICGMLAVARGS